MIRIALPHVGTRWIASCFQIGGASFFGRTLKSLHVARTGPRAIHEPSGTEAMHPCDASAESRCGAPNPHAAGNVVANPLDNYVIPRSPTN